ncbi:MAG: cobaltochelatase subunit CobN [Bacillota bacterium]|nr:cobaltochelatase subunit CobN [Bacillota bacterium]
MFRVLYYTTSDGEYINFAKAAETLNERYPNAFRIEFFGKNTSRCLDDMAKEMGQADFVLMTLMGTYFGDGDIDSLLTLAKERNVPVHIQSSVMRDTKKLRKMSGQSKEFCDDIERFIFNGGAENYVRLFLHLANRIKRTTYAEAACIEVPTEAIYYRGQVFVRYEDFAKTCPPRKQNIGLIFYRSQFVSGNVRMVDAIVEEGERRGVRMIPMYFYSVPGSDIASRPFKQAFTDLLCPSGEPVIEAVINLAGFSINTGVSSMAPDTITDLERFNLPIIKGFSSTGTRADWQKSTIGLTQIDYSMNVVMPEFDGQIMGQLISHKEKRVGGELDIPYHSPFASGIGTIVEMAMRYGALRQKKNQEKRIAIILHNYPASDSNIGTASGLDTFRSVAKLIDRLSEEGYRVERRYETGDDLLADVMRHGTNEREWVDVEAKADRTLYLPEPEYRAMFEAMSSAAREQVTVAWGEAPGEILVEDGGIRIPGFENGNLFIGIQPARGFGDDPDKITHSPDLVPHHQYIAYYHYLKNVWKADAYLHVGTHGTLEFLPGKSVGLGEDCWPNRLLGAMPNFYYYIIKNPGEGTIAKRRASAAIIDYLIPRLSFVQDYDDLENLELAISQYEKACYEGIESTTAYWIEVLEQIRALHLDSDLGLDLESAAREDLLARLWKYLYEIKNNYITKGLHVLGEAPTGADLAEMLLVLMRVRNGDIPSLVEAYVASRGYDYEALVASPERIAPKDPTPSDPAEGLEQGGNGERNGDLLARLKDDLRRMVEGIVAAMESDVETVGGAKETDSRIVNWLQREGVASDELRIALHYMIDVLIPNLKACSGEAESLIRGLSGQFILPGKSGNVSRGGADLLPTGRNFYTIDPLAVPTKSAWRTGMVLGDQMLEEHLRRYGKYPESVAIVLWGLSTIRSKGDDLAEIYYLMGLEPEWEPGTQRVRSLRVIPTSELGRPRIDVTVKISGVFRDIFPHQISMLDKAVAMVEALEESEEENFVKRHVAADERDAIEAGIDPAIARREALYRVFGCKPGAYGAGVSHVVDESAWSEPEDIADVFLNWGSYVYGRDEVVFSRRGFEKRLSRVEATIQNATSRETDILSVDDYYQYHGGLAGAVKRVTGSRPEMYCGDSSDPDRVKIRTADQELKYVYRSRVLNSEWIESMKVHGYKAAGDFSKMFRYALGWDATVKVLDNWMYDALAEKYLLDAAMQEFFEQNNPQAMHSMIETLLEANQRGMWNASEEMLRSLYELLLQAEGHLENRMM